jgi:plasmid segregation protein ParM
MAQIIGLDLGYGFVKVTNGETGYVFPSVIGDGRIQSTYSTGAQSDGVNTLVIELNDKVYFVGKAAIKHSKFAYRDLSTTRTETVDWQVLMFAALSLFCSFRNNLFEVVTGLPPGHMYMANTLKKQVQEEGNRIRIFRNDKWDELGISIGKIEVVPQPLGAFWSQGLDNMGKVRNEYLGRIGILDIGFKTTDLATVEDGEFLPGFSRTIPVGMADAYYEIGSMLATKYGYEKASYALDQAVVKGRISVFGKAVDIVDIRSQAFESLASKILVEVSSEWNLAEYDQILLSGGGGQALADFLLSQLPQAQVVCDPITANSKGYLAWANRVWRLDLNGEDGVIENAVK